MNVVEVPDVTPIEESPDYNPISAEYAPDTTAETRGAWFAQVKGYSPDWFAAQFYEIVKDIPVFWERPGDLVRQYYDQLRTEPIGHAYTEPSRNEYIKIRLADPGFRGIVRAKLLGEYINTNDARTALMHKVMRRSIDILRARANLNFAALSRSLVRLRDDTHNSLLKRDRNLADTVKVINAHVRAVADQAIRDVKKWTLTDVALPLQKTADHDRAQTLKMVGETQRIAHDYTDKQLALKLAPIFAAIAGMQLTLNGLVDESNDCVKPMCGTMGPKTDLGKLLAGLKIAKWLAIFAALETIDVKELEALALAVAGTEGRLGDWVATHVLDELAAEHR